MDCNCPSVTPITPSLASLCSGNQLVLFLMILDNYLDRHCDITDPCHRFQPRTSINPRYDFVVIGGGSAGATVVGRLAESNFSVLLIEAGPEEPAVNQMPALNTNLRKSILDWQYTSEPEKVAFLNQEGQKCYWPRGKVLGGCSAINGLVYLRGSRKDFDKWADLGNPGWSYDEVLPFFLRSEDNQQIDRMDKKFHSVGGPLPVSQYSTSPTISDAIIQGGQELGYQSVDINGRNHTGFGFAQATMKNGHRMSPARAFLRPLRNRRNLHVMLNSTATKIIFDSSKRASGVEFFYNGVFYRVAVTKEVIVSGGTMNSPQILMNSGIGPTRHLTEVGIPTVHHLPGVGENFQDHVALYLKVSINETEKPIFTLNTFRKYLRSGTGPLSTTGLVQMAAFIKTKYTDPNEDNPDIQLIFGGYDAPCDKIRISEEIIDKRQSFDVGPTLLRPKSRGLIRLRNNDPLSKPLFYGRYLTNPDDVKVLVEGVKFAVKLMETKSMKKYDAVLDRTPTKGCENFSFGTDSYWTCAVKRDTATNNHQVGTCKMGPNSDPLAVVDSQLRVYGVKGVRVADASIMPLEISANTQTTAIMIGERAAEFIRQTYAKDLCSGKSR